MSYTLDFSNQANEDIAFHKKVWDKAILKELLVLLNELSDHPFVGTGKPEPLKYELAGFWSRRINREHRLVYQVGKEKVLIYSAKGHYL
ncbi:Txe/YoeB family addiction module toxin [Cognataquiflexum rubidum]|uniref:Txe/YoeB family addiction module toxin n=1 Tax=Cognataquiflexum rubidum TaxID=2922273 RepID=UPI001F12FC8C|nr:Txe/YoeB family addiction module toxin [Cognataquiflexum rubidum]MCH6233206.1 Txe/YoeB family addiction module toxin [Cognataquiflexum rubidum]